MQLKTILKSNVYAQKLQTKKKKKTKNCLFLEFVKEKMPKTT